MGLVEWCSVDLWLPLVGTEVCLAVGPPVQCLLLVQSPSKQQVQQAQHPSCPLCHVVATPACPAIPQSPSEQEVLRARHMSIHQVTKLEELWRSNPAASGVCLPRLRLLC